MGGIIAECRANGVAEMAIRIFAAGVIATDERTGRESVLIADTSVAEDERKTKVVFDAIGSEHGTRAQGDFTGDGFVDSRDQAIVNAALGAGTGNLSGDANGDRTVNGSDFSILLANFGNNGTLAQGDLTGDGKVDFLDFQLLERQFGTTWPGAFDPFGAMAIAGAPELAFSEVPEPGMGLIGLGALMWLRRRQR